MKELLRKFKAVYRFDLLGNLEYRSYFLFWALMESLPFLIMFFLWKFIYADQSMVAGYSLREMITYYFLVYVIDRLTVTYLEWNIAGRIKNGQFAQFLCRPLSHRLTYLASSTSQRVTRALVGLPVFALGLVFFGHYLIMPQLDNFLLFVLFLPVVWMINFFLAFITGYAAFWMEKADSVIYFRWSLTYYLSGQFLPLTFYGSAGKLLNFLPFRYAFGFPIEVFLGRLTSREVLVGFLLGITWVLAFVVIERLLYRVGIKKFKAIGN